MRTSLLLVLSIVALAAWTVFLSPLFEYWIVRSSTVQPGESFLNAAYIAGQVVVPSILILWFATSFFFVARSVRAVV
ncbi:hypothetical protein B1991_18200 [Rhodanobacter lindaniclasticus]|uniref:Uncharacterized protein n=1 Tax=Rhodanobacter lindaniclasticus TaxID=75310 RepID=A0A4S3K7I6_9GAMM|nr:hypothetical protein B1991_18200 [Rhodanobacter lindaniclasticus]